MVLIREICNAIINSLLQQGLILEQDGLLNCSDYSSSEYFHLNLLANVIQNTLQRYAIVLNLIDKPQQIRQSELEQKALVIGQRLLARHGIQSPEFLDTKVVASLINSLNKHQLVNIENEIIYGSEQLTALNETVTSLLHNNVTQSITQIL